MVQFDIQKLYKNSVDGNVSTVGELSVFTEVLNDNTGPVVMISWPRTFRVTVIKYTAERDGQLEAGELTIVNNNSATSLTESRNQISPLGLFFSTDINGEDVRLFYTLSESGFNANFKYTLTQW